MIGAAASSRRAVVIGGGLLGLEAAWGLKRRGLSVAVVHLMPTLMERQLDVAAAELLRRELEGRGIAIFTNGQTEDRRRRARRGGRARRRPPHRDGIRRLGHRHRPNIALARAAELDVNRGIVVGDDMATSDRDIYEVGECIEHNGQVFGLGGADLGSGEGLRRAAGRRNGRYVPPPVFTSLKITGVDVFSAGVLAAADPADQEITLHDAKRGVYKKVILRDDRIAGCVLYGSVSDGPWYVELMRHKIDVSPFR